MRRQLLVATTTVVGCTVALTGCGSKSHTATKTTTAVQTATTITTPTAMDSSTSTGTSSSYTSPAATDSQASGSGSASDRTCSSKQVSATINGKSKCLEAGQECSAKAVDEYTQYGFVCEQKENRWILRKNS